MRIVPAFVIDRLPLRWWRIGNLYLGMRLHFCIGGGRDGPVRTVEWNGREIGIGRRVIDLDTIPPADPSWDID